MSFLASLFAGENAVKIIGETLDSLFTSDEERIEQAVERYRIEREYNYLEKKLEADQNMHQMAVNKAEAQTGNLFIAGWRPAIGWIGAISLFYQFILYPLLLWLPVDTPPEPINSEILWTMITGMLGIAGMRTYDKKQKTDTSSIAVNKNKL